MLGAIIGDIVGSRFEWHNIKTKEFDFLTYRCSVTDDSIMSLAIAQAILDCNGEYGKLGAIAVNRMQAIGRPYPTCGFGGMFYQWMYSDNPKPYGSYGNGAAMRVSACGFAANSLEEAKSMSKAVTEVTHNHPEGIKGAEATAVAIYLAREGKSILDIRDYIDKHYYPMDFTLDGIRETYTFNETCQETVPQAIMAFLESTDFEDAIRNAISIGGDSDTLAAITGGIAEAYYGIPTEIRKHALTYLDQRLLKILVDFENVYAPLMEKTTRGVRTTAVTKRDKNKVVTGGRAEMIESAVDMADMDLAKTGIDSAETTSQKLFLHLFEACNILRGPINQDEYKTYVIPILFFKRISDTYRNKFGGIFMAIAQDAFYIPDDIATGLATGLYRRIGSVVRYAVGPNKGQIVKHLKPIDLKAAEQAQGLGAKALQFAQQHKTEIGIVVIGAAAIGAAWWGYNKWKNTEPKVLVEFRMALKTYIDAIRNGNMSIETINALMKALDALKKHKDYEKISIQLTAEDLEVLVGRIYDYTIKLAEDNNVSLTEDELSRNKGVIIDLRSYLKTQKRIFAAAA